MLSASSLLVSLQAETRQCLGVFSRTVLTSLAAGGAIGGLGHKVGGPLAADGMIGKHFTETGAIGGAIQQNLGKPSGSLGDKTTFSK